MPLLTRFSRLSSPILSGLRRGTVKSSWTLMIVSLASKQEPAHRLLIPSRTRSKTKKNNLYSQLTVSVAVSLTGRESKPKRIKLAILDSLSSRRIDLIRMQATSLKQPQARNHRKTYQLRWVTAVKLTLVTNFVMKAVNAKSKTFVECKLRESSGFATSSPESLLMKEMRFKFQPPSKTNRRAQIVTNFLISPRRRLVQRNHSGSLRRRTRSRSLKKAP